VADWTIIGTAAVTAASGLAGSVLGYLGAKLQGNVALRQAEVELDKLRLGSAAEALTRREELYGHFITVNDEIMWSGAFDGELVSDEAQEWRERYRSLRARMIMVDDPDVEAAALNLHQRLRSLFLALLSLPWVSYVRDRPGRGGQRPPRVSIARAISASAE